MQGGRASGVAATGVNARALALLGAAQLAIGAAAIFARFALTATGPLAASALRMGIAAAPIVVFALARGAYARYDRATERRLLAASFALALHFALWLTSLQHATVAVSTLLVCTTPIFAEAWTVARRRTWRPLAAAGIAAAVAGVAIIAGVPAHGNSPLGIGLALGGAVAFAAYLLLVRASDARYTTLAVVARTYPLAAGLLSGAALLAHDRLPPLAAHAAWGGLLAMALGSQLFGHVAVNAAVRTLSATLVGMTILLEPVVAAVTAAFVFGERLAPATAVGALVILGGIALAVRAEAKSAV
jgi:drug/metabolite transporter (DMT)-like permease